ncbi:uncharacterized protein Hap1MRO34_023063 [Clarias gariepinus]
MSVWRWRDSPRLRQEEKKPQTSGFDLTGQHESNNRQVSPQQSVFEREDEEITGRAREEGHVDVIFPGPVTHHSCCIFICELLKSVLYQRQQLPVTYDQMVSFRMQQLATTQLEEGAVRNTIKSSEDLTWQWCKRTLQVITLITWRSSSP